MKRREMLCAGVAGGAVVALSGCTGILGSDDENDEETPTTPAEPDITNQTFEYYFQDSTGTLGQVGDDVSEDVEDWQIVHNELEESEWQEMEDNDLDGEGGAADALEEGKAPQAEGFEGSLEDIIQRTEEILENPQEAFSESGIWQVEGIEEEHEAVVFTRAITAATWGETGIASSGAADLIIPSIAEPLRNQLDLEIPGYSLSTLGATESCSADSCSWAEDSAPRDQFGQTIVNSEFHHPIGLLQYENGEGKQEIKYAEVTGPEDLFTSWIRDPEDSHYAMPLDAETETVNNVNKIFPEHFVSALEYNKARELQRRGILEPGELDAWIAGSIYSLVDDIGNDQGPSRDEVKSYGDTPGLDVIVEDSFGESLEEFKQSPTSQKAEQLEYAGRGLKLAFERHGYDEPLRLSGTLEDPTYEHLARDEFESIIDEREQQASS